MSRRGADQIFEVWARWCVSGGVCLPGGSSMMAKMIECKGHMNFGSGGKAAPVVDCVEANVEAALMQLFTTDPITVKVVRFEYLGRFIGVDDGEPLNQMRKAHQLGLSLRTYERRLAKGRNHVLTKLGKGKQ